MNYFEEAEEGGIECFHIGDVLARSSDDVEDSTAEAEEGVECFHIGDIFARTSDADGQTTDDETSTVDPTAGRNQNRKKKLIYVGAAVVAAAIATAIGVLVSRQNSAQKSVAAVSLTEEAAEIPWFACLDKESCFRQASLLRFTYEDRDRLYGGYSDPNLYGCFLENFQAKWVEGGTEEQMATPGQQRIWCYDVKSNPHERVDICGNPIPNLPTGRPSVTPSTSFRPSISTQPSFIPTSSLRPSISAAPSASPSSHPSAIPTSSLRPTLSTKPSASPTSPVPSASPTSPMPSASPSISLQPSISFQPSNTPSKSADPSTSPSGQPSLNPTR